MGSQDVASRQPGLVDVASNVSQIYVHVVDLGNDLTESGRRWMGNKTRGVLH